PVATRPLLAASKRVHIPKERERQIRAVKGDFEEDERQRISTKVKGFAHRSKFLLGTISIRER
ncbi:MAG: hypothetical protein U0Y68_27570, partial [Blastocatellia bacterium]